MKFLSRHKIALTPLSPIHIGCGEDFEPTNYVIDAERKLLYGFDAGRAVLPEKLAKELSTLGEQGNLQGIQKFFRDNQDCFKPLSHVLMPVAVGVALDYKNKIGKIANLEANGNKVFNQFTIERHTHSRNTPYVPGSSLKGALRTAWMDELNDRRPVTDKEERTNSAKLAKRLLCGDFATSPLRLLKVGDLMPAGDLDRSILYAVNRYKRPKFDQKTGQEKSPKGIVARKECILSGQYRALTGEIVVQDLGGKGIAEGEKRNVPHRAMRSNLVEIAKSANAYHLHRLREELAEMDKTGLVNPEWKQTIESLLKGKIEKFLQEGRAMLVRLGRYGGAESKTLTDVANIKIMGKRVDGKQQYDFRSHTTTYWLAAQMADDRKHLIPFGWALLEIDPQEELSELRAWCGRESRNRPDMREEYAELAALKAQADEEAAQRRAEREAAEAAKRQEERIAEQNAREREQRLASLSEAGREIEAFIGHFQQRAEALRGRKERANGADHQKASALAKRAREGENWTADDKKAAAAAIEEWLPKVVDVEMKDVRKKLKLAELKST